MEIAINNGTAINGNVLKNVYISGNIVDGFAKNGRTIYRKDKIILKNMIYNADFRKGIDGYSNYDNANIIKVDENVLNFEKINTSNINIEISCTLNENLKCNHLYYIRFSFNVNKIINGGKSYGSKMYGDYGYSSAGANIDNDINNFQTFSTTLERKKPSQNYRLTFFSQSNSDENTIFMIKELMCIDVTKLYNSGLNEYDIKELLNEMAYFPDEIENEKYITTHSVIQGLENIEVTKVFIQMVNASTCYIYVNLKNNSDTVQEAFSCHIDLLDDKGYKIFGSWANVGEIEGKSETTITFLTNDNCLNSESYKITIN